MQCRLAPHQYRGEVKMESFVVKHYNEQAHPSIKGNGFDGLVIGEYREEAETFIKFVNELIAAQSIGGKAAQTNNSQSVAALNELRNDILLSGLPYSKSWADRVTYIIQCLNAEAALHT
jgi:hypothetical protein